MAHSHEHTHNNRTSFNKAFGIGILLNSAYIVIEFISGIVVNSMALIADAGHNLSDVLGLLLAWGASYLARTDITKRKTYGLRKSTILAALFNAIILFIAVGAIAIEAVRKLIEPQPVEGFTIITVAAIGVFINTITALLFIKGRKSDINIKGAFLHMAADAGVSLGVVAAGLIIQYTGVYIVDPLISIVIVIVITYGTWGLLKDSFMLSMDAVPGEIDTNEVENYLNSIPEVSEVHDLHIWAISTTENALTVHLLVAEYQRDDKLLKKVCADLYDKFNIHHPTIQIERETVSESCNRQSV
ncbi:MAG: cation transporter [Melioribacteraceae bacterium]|nr:cation transporter [Melioribacteraceae bacterium]